MSNIFNEFKYIQIKEDYDTTPGRLTPEDIGRRLSKLVFRYDEPRDGEIKSVEGVNLTLVKIYPIEGRLFIDFRGVDLNVDYFDTEDISNLHTYILTYF